MTAEALATKELPVEEVVDQALAIPKPAARGSDLLRGAGAAMRFVLGALGRRIFGRGHARWPLQLELLVAATRGAWSVMTRIGMVRWRNVGENAGPLRTDGLAPRFVRILPREDAPLFGAWLEPPGVGDSVILYFHGGGFVFGSLRTHGEVIGALARAAGARTLALEYRLAPEHPLPAAPIDAVRAYRHLLAIGVAPGRIALAGDSAGGTLVLNTLVRLRDAGLPLPGAAVAISPWVDLGCSGESFVRNAGHDYVGREHCLLAAQHALAGQDAASPDHSPLFASLAGLPPLLVQAGSLETLVDQIRAFAARAREAGGDFRYSEYAEMVHVWHLLKGATPEGTRAIEEAATFIREHTATAG